MSDLFQVRIWGARGAVAAPGDKTKKYGGNTSCVEVTCGDETLIFDAGTGLRALGEQIARDMTRADKQNKKNKRLNLFFTHCHHDHIAGLPFFAPFYDANCNIDLWSGHLPGPDKTKRMICNYMSPPYFPIGPEVFSAKLRYRDFDPCDTLKPAPKIKLETLPLKHHDACVGYRIKFDKRSICYITDTTHTQDDIDESVVEFVRDTDLMIYDATYTDKEFPKFWNFGHSTWEEGLRITKAANVQRYCIFHHNPSRNDAELDKIGQQCKALFKRSWVASEGLVIKV